MAGFTQAFPGPPSNSETGRRHPTGWAKLNAALQVTVILQHFVGTMIHPFLECGQLLALALFCLLGPSVSSSAA